MVKAELSKQLMITVDNRVGTLAEISSVVAASGINMVAICAYAVDNKGVVMFVCEDNKRAAVLLKAKHYDVREEEVILLNVENKPGALQSITQRLADAAMDVTLIYGSVEKKGKVSPIILVCEDIAAAFTVIKMA